MTRCARTSRGWSAGFFRTSLMFAALILFGTLASYVGAVLDTGLLDAWRFGAFDGACSTVFSIGAVVAMGAALPRPILRHRLGAAAGEGALVEVEVVGVRGNGGDGVRGVLGLALALARLFFHLGGLPYVLVTYRVGGRTETDFAYPDEAVAPGPARALVAGDRAWLVR